MFLLLYNGLYATASKYVNGGLKYIDFYVFDSANKNNVSSSTGVVLTISESRLYNKTADVNYLEITNKK